MRADDVSPIAESSVAQGSLEQRPLVVDLDGTLLRTDLLHETFWSLAAAQPVSALRLALANLGDRPRLKLALAEAAEVDIDTLPVNSEVAALIEQARLDGRTVLIATAAAQPLAETVAARIAPGVEVAGTTAGRNLKGAEKGRYLTERFGEGAFDYIGDSDADLEVWPHAATAIAVTPSAKIQARLHESSQSVETLNDGARPRNLLKALRPHQWVKNLLVFAPLVAAHNFSAQTLALGVLAFIAFSFAASAVYVLNDLLDLAADRRHPTKCARPFASGDAPITLAIPLTLALLGVAFVLAVGAGLSFAACLLGYMIATTAYSTWLKRELFADVVMLGGLYTLRVIAGAAATGIVLSPWLLACSGFGFLALAIVKRQTELRRGLARGVEAASGRAYTGSDLPMLGALGASSGFAAVVVFALYVNTTGAEGLYPAPWALWMVCPLLIYWLGRMLVLADRGEIDDDPIVFALKDRISLFVGAAVALSFLAASTL